MPRNRLRVCTAMTAPPLLPAKTGIRIPRVVLSYLQTHERRHMRYPLLCIIWKIEAIFQLFLSLHI